MVSGRYICQVRIFLSVLVLPLIALSSCSTQEKKTAKPALLNTDSIVRWMEGVNAFYMACGVSDTVLGTVCHGKNSLGKPLDSLTIFEGASLSKTLTAHIYWQLLEENRGLEMPFQAVTENRPCLIRPLHLLQHRIRMQDSVPTTCEPGQFAYSEENYLLLQKHIEQYTGKGLEDLAQTMIFRALPMPSSSFIWKNPGNHTDGYVMNDTLHRKIYHFDRAQSNGTLYACGADMVQFIRSFVQSGTPDSIVRYTCPVGGFDRLLWGAGMGIEKKNDGTWLWQWGSNWSFNHILLINKEKKTWFLILSNSIWGAKRIRETTNKFFNTDFQLFNYIKWY